MSRPGTHVAIASDGRFAVLAAMDNSLLYWNLQGEEPPRRAATEGQYHGDRDIARSPAGGLRALRTDRFRRSGVNHASQEKDLARGVAAGTELIAFSPDGLQLFSTHADRSIWSWDVQRRQAIGRPSITPKPVSGLAALPDARRVLISLSGPTYTGPGDRPRARSGRPVWAWPFHSRKTAAGHSWGAEM